MPNNQNKKKQNGINCAMCKSFVKEFFTHSISLTVRDLVIAHILRCPACEDEYVMYSLNIGLTNWDIKKEARKLTMSCGEHPEKCSKTREALEESENTKVFELKQNYYTRACLNWDVGKLLKLTAFAQLLDNNFGNKERSELDEQLADNRLEFWKHEALKFCKYVDHLEQCLAKPLEQSNEK